ncbi:SDR family oxidoreductase [Mangrovimonas xylaniphaga]|uniref:SDR family oxidoreductase n=1 Tax=Mangrovimonas xylaniphaga TaxID=1645915 RepID=UPI0006B48586|nr:SDR family oxidoreductase [Mangrovimonas xylaniphaga]
METLEHKVALITGGTKGIGFGIAQSLMAQGVNVAITSRSSATAHEAAGMLNAHKTTKAKAIGVKGDVKDFESLKEAVADVLSEFGQLDILVANAGVGHFDSVEDLSIEDWKDTVDTNLSGVFYTLKAGVEALRKSKGYFITISSLAGTNFFANGSAYNASKFGVTGFTQAAMLDLRKYGIKVSTIMPGSVATYFNNHVPNDGDAWKIQSEDIGELVVDLVKMNPRTLPSKIEVRPSMPPSK